MQHPVQLVSAKQALFFPSAIRILVAVFLCLGLAACSKPATPTSAARHVKEDNFLLIGLVPELNIFRQADRYRLIADYLSVKIGVRVKLVVLPSYGDIIGNFTTGGMDGAFFGSLTYAIAHKKLGVEAMVRVEDPDGASTCRGAIFSRRDSGIRNVRDMRGKVFTFVSKASASGYLVARDFFRKGGIDDYKRYLKEAYFDGTHEDAIYDVLNRKADAGAAKSSIFNGMATGDPRIADELRIMYESPDFPETTLAVRKDLDAATKNRLREVLLDMSNDPAGKVVLEKFGASRFVATTDDDFRPLYKYLKELGINLSTYDYADVR